jgi:WD40 repeat protein
VQLWDVAAGAKKGPPLTLADKIVQYDFTPDGSKLLLTDGAGNVAAWDLATFRKRQEWRNEDQTTTPATSASGDGRYYSYGANKGTVKVRDVEAGTTIGEFRVAKDTSYHRLSPDGRRIVLASLDGSLQLLETATGREVWATKLESDFRGADFSPDGTRLACSTERGASILDTATGRELSVLAGPYQPHIAFSPSGDRVVTGAYDGVIKLWDVASGQEVLTLTGHTDQVVCVYFTRDGRQLLSSGRNGTLRIWDGTPLPEPKK